MPFHRDQSALGGTHRDSWPAWLWPCSALGCEQREAPSEIRLEIPSVIASRDVVAVSVQAINAQGVRKLVTDGADYALEPADLGSVSKAGMLKCERSGDGKVTVSIAGVSRSVAVRCRIVDRIEAANVGRVELSAGPFQPKVRALDKAGAELSDVDVTFFSKNSGVAYPEGRTARAQIGGHGQFGRARG